MCIRDRICTSRKLNSSSLLGHRVQGNPRSSDSSSRNWIRTVGGFLWRAGSWISFVVGRYLTFVGISAACFKTSSCFPTRPVSYTHLRAHETDSYLVCRLLLEKKKKHKKQQNL